MSIEALDQTRGVGVELDAGYAEFEAALDVLLDDDDLGARLGAQGRRYVRDHYAWLAVLSGYEELVGTLVGQWGAPLPRLARPGATTP